MSDSTSMGNNSTGRFLPDLSVPDWLDVSEQERLREFVTPRIVDGVEVWPVDEVLSEFGEST